MIRLFTKNNFNCYKKIRYNYIEGTKVTKFLYKKTKLKVIIIIIYMIISIIPLGGMLAIIDYKYIIL